MKCLLQGTPGVRFVKREGRKEHQEKYLGRLKMNPTAVQLFICLQASGVQNRPCRGPFNHNLHQKSKTCSPRTRSHRILRWFPSHWHHSPFKLAALQDSPACRFHGVAPALGPVMPNPAKERSPQELTEGQPSNLSSSQEMKELYQQ